MHQKELYENRLIRLSEVCSLTSRSRSSIYRDMAAGRFPKARKIGPRAIAWNAQTVVQWARNTKEV